ncbi:MAG TPA: GEVED domain-containing protein [Hymenobacter sp.]|jgi:hypothetical protein|uniref:GEVED domain-containing protein n=1 Tax=Hymenobacter sp. TaxID=1898978 RepID=UPI002ED8FB9B
MGGLLLAALLHRVPQIQAQSKPAATWCGTAPTTPADRARVLRDVVPVEQRLAARKTLGGPMVYVPLSLHVVRLNDGSGGTNEEEIFRAIAGTNELLASANMQFYVCGPVQHLDNSAWYDLASGPTENAMCGPNDNPNAINVYYTHSVSTGGNVVCGYSYISGSRALLSCSDTRTLAHELGHVFGLAHPQQDGNNPVVSERELVRRTNCTAKGDQLCDTPADPFERPGATQSNCAYTGTITDANGDLFTPLMANTMSYWQCGGNAFTPGQFARMEATRLTAHAARTCAVAAAPAPSQLTAAVVPYGGGIALGWTDNATTELGYFVERAVGGGTSFVTVGYAPANATAYTDASPPAGALARYRVKPINAQAGFSNEASRVAEITYCAAAFTGSNCGPTGLPIYLDDVQVLQGTTPVLSNVGSGCGTYSSFIGNGGTVRPAGTYTLRTRVPTLPDGSFYTQVIYAWADFNHNGSFADPGEQLCQIRPTYNVLTTTFTVPATAKNGWTRLRVRTQSDFYATLPDACATGVYGETEDYTLVVTGEVTAAAASSGPTGSHFTLFPNPSSAQTPAEIVLTGDDAPAGAKCYVSNMLGQQVAPTLLLRPEVRTELPTRGLAAGVYVVRVQSAAGESQQRLVLY